MQINSIMSIKIIATKSNWKKFNKKRILKSSLNDIKKIRLNITTLVSDYFLPLPDIKMV